MCHAARYALPTGKNCQLRIRTTYPAGTERIQEAHSMTGYFCHQHLYSEPWALLLLLLLLWMLLRLLPLSHGQHFFRIQPEVIFQQWSNFFPSLEMQASDKNPSTISYQRIHMKPNLKNILVCSCRDATARQSQLCWKQQFCWSHCHHPSPLFFCGKILLSQHQPIR